MKPNRQLQGILVASALLAAAPASFGQAVYGNIFGTVVDANGAAIPGATIVVTDAAKGTSQTYTSNSAGEFTADHLIPDTYNVKITFNGFKTFEASGLTIFADTARKLEATLQVGGTDQTIQVSANDIPQLKVDRADVSTNFSGQEIQDLPIGDRNFTNLQLLLPGAQELGWSHAASENPQGSKQIQVDGQAFGGVAFELDGTDNQDPILGIIVINPNIDSLAQSQITTQNFDAEFGKAVSSVVTVQTKSGSNQFHGSAFEYYQNDALHARDPFSQSKAQGIAPSTRHQFGGSLGGPIIKDKVFFFGDYQGLRQTVGSSILATVPTTHLLNTCLGSATPYYTGSGAGCDFSEYGTPIFNPQTHVAYAGSVIPAAQVSKQFLNVLSYFKNYAPNIQTNGVSPYSVNGVAQPLIYGVANNYGASGSGVLNTNQYDVRIDAQTSQKVHSFGRFSHFGDILTGGTAFGDIGGPGFGLGGYGGTSQGANASAALGTDIVLSPSLVLDIRAGYYRYNIVTSKYDGTTPLATQLGIPGENLGGLTQGAPFFNISEVGNPNQSSPSNGSPNGAGAATGPQYGGGLNVTRCNCPLIEHEDQFQLVENLTKTIGTHAIKFGSDLRYARNLRVPSDNDRTGINNFNSQYTSDGNGNGGLGFATFALGEVTSFNRYVSTSTNAKEFQKRDFFYAQDTWRATPKLTLNYGLRYELYFPETINTPGQGAVLNVDTGYLQVAGIGGIPSDMGFSPTFNGYNPRLGVAYQVTDKTVVRAGYGRSFDIGVFGSIFGHVATQNLPVLANQQITATAGPNSGAFNLSQGPTAAVATAIPSNGLLPSPGYEVTSKARPLTMRLPTIDAWNLEIQQSVTPTLSFTIGYVANKGTHTLSAGDGNNTNPNEAAIFLPAQYSITGNQLHFDPNGPSGLTPSASGATSNTTLLQRYYGGSLPACKDAAYGTANLASNGGCGWTNGIQYYGDNQDTHYNSLQLTMTKTFNKHYSFNANYAWQQSINFASSYATWSKIAVKGRDDSTRQQQFIGYGLFDLPFGQNERFLANSNYIVRQIVGGFQLSPIVTYASGLPFTLNLGSCPGTPGDVPCYANGNRFRFTKHTTGYAGNNLSFYDPQPLGEFTTPGTDQIGNVGRNSVFGPRFFDMDLAVTKSVSIKERYTAQIRLDAYNVFNHINFGNPSGNVGNGAITSEPGGANPRYLQLSGRFQF